MGLHAFPRDMSHIALERNLKAIKNMGFVQQYTNGPYRQVFFIFLFAFFEVAMHQHTRELSFLLF